MIFKMDITEQHWGLTANLLEAGVFSHSGFTLVRGFLELRREAIPLIRSLGKQKEG